MGSQVRLNQVVWGLLAGVLGTCVGFAILAGWWCNVNNKSMAYFAEVVFWGSQLYKDSILTVSVLFNVAIFYGALRKHWYRFARGLMITMILSVMAIVILQAQILFAS
jgi:hypothetical protein